MKSLFRTGKFQTKRFGRYWNSLLLFFVFWLFVPTISQAAIKITEVAWMGTAESGFSEWIELHNDGGESVSLAGWKILESSGDTVVFTLSKEITAGGYVVVERVTPSAPDAVPGFSDEEGSFGGAGLANTGEDLVLADASGNRVDELSFASGWPAGDAESKQTMQLDGSTWKTAAATPGSASNTENTNNDTGNNDENDQPTSAGSSSKKKTNPVGVLKEPKVTITHPSYFVAGIPETIKGEVAIPEGSTRVGYFMWSSGDGYAEESKELKPFRYSYQYPGKYTITLAYFKNQSSEDPIATAEFTATVVAAGIEIEQIDHQTLRISNKGKQTIELRGWTLKSGTATLVFPRYTPVASGGSITIPASRLGITSFNERPVLLNSEGAVAAQLRAPTVVAVTANATGGSKSSIKSSSVTREIEEEVVAPGITALAADGKVQKNSQSAWLLVLFGALIIVASALFFLLQKTRASRE